MADNTWSANRAWDLGIIRYVEGESRWVGEMHLYGEDEPYADVEHDHQRGITYG